MRLHIILYGVRGIREEIEHMLDNAYEIVGYSDSDPIYMNLLEYEYKPFYTPDKLKNVLIDYIVISVQNNTASSNIVNKLIEYGIPFNKIIETCRVITLKSPFCIPLDSFISLQSNKIFEGLFLGMSYTCYGILTYCFSKQFYKLAQFSGDIYFHYKNIEYINNNFDNQLKNIKYVVFEMPYYAFNWDLSKATKTVRSRLALMDRFGDYHNYGNNEIEKWYIQEYQILKKMFWEKLSFNSSVYSNNFENRISSHFVEEEHPFYKNEHIWTKIRYDTLIENNTLFKKTLDILYNNNSCIKVIVVVPPFYMKYLYNQMKEIDIMKKIFYKNIAEIQHDYPIQILDFIDVIKDKECFRDIYHLNAQGAYQFSNYLNEVFEKRVY